MAQLNPRTATGWGPKNPPPTGPGRAIEDAFLTNGDAAPVQAALTRARDESILQAYRQVLEPIFPKGLALLAGGAYARGQTFPYSELDIVLLLDSEKKTEPLKEILPEFVRLLWNAGLRVNISTLTIVECLGTMERAGVAALTLLDRRLLAGDAATHDELEARLPAVLNQHRDKLRQRLCQSLRARHAQHANTAHHAEPNVKDGPGGLQDARVVEWLALLKGEHPERPEFAAAVSLISSARCFLHYTAECDHNTLDFDAQERLAQKGFAGAKTAAVWMRSYFDAACVIFNEAQRAVEEAERSQSSLLENFREYRSRLSNQEFTVSRDHLLVRNPAQIAADPALVFRLLEFMARHGVPAAPETLRRLESAREAFAAYCAQPGPVWGLLKNVLGSPHAGLALRTLQSTGLMRALFPEWGAIEHLVIADSEYRFTVDERTLRIAEHLLELASNTVPARASFAELYSEIDDPAVLLFGLLFHEMGDAASDAVHAAATRTAMAEEARDAAEFLVRHRFELSEAMSGRDLDDPVTLHALAGRVGTIERLRLLTILTYARLVTLTDEAKIPFRLDQLWRTYTATHHELIRELEVERIQQAPEFLPRNADFVKGFPSRYLRVHTAAEIADHLRLYEQSRPTGVAARIEAVEGAYRVTVVARDKRSLFASIAGAISSFGLDILKAEAFSNSTGIVLDTFVVSDPKRMLQLNPGEIDRLNDMLQRIVLGRTDAHKLMRGRALPEPNKRAQPPQVRFDSEACPTATLIEIDAEDRPGLLYSLATVISANACNIEVVLVDTKGHRAMDVFYVAHDMHKLSPEMQARLKEKLLAVC